MIMGIISKIRQGIKLLICCVKSFKEMEKEESNPNTVSQMKTEELVTLGEERFKKYESRGKTREEWMKLVNGYLNSNNHWHREQVKSYIDKLNADDMSSIPAKEAVERLKKAMAEYEENNK